MTTWRPTDKRMLEIADDLADFVHRVAKDEKAYPDELAILPEMVRILYGMAD